ncbi:MAG: flagellar biosynthetic protein FliP [Myxococcales bacterium]
MWQVRTQSGAVPCPPARSRRWVRAAGLTLLALVVILVSATALAQQPRFSLDLEVGEDGGYVAAIKVILLLAGLTFAPTLILSATSFTRIVIVLSLLRQAVGVPQLPPNRVVVGLALFLTFFTMAPVWSAIQERAVAPYEAGELNEREALTAAIEPLRTFMLRQTREKDLELFLGIMEAPRPKTAADVSTLAIIPAFMLSELQAAFQMGALLFLPFLVIDMVVASILMSMGMMMLPPMIVALPLKLFVFVLADGWGLVVRSLAESFVRVV